MCIPTHPSISLTAGLSVLLLLIACPARAQHSGHHSGGHGQGVGHAGGGHGGGPGAATGHHGGYGYGTAYGYGGTSLGYGYGIPTVAGAGLPYSAYTPISLPPSSYGYGLSPGSYGGSAVIAYYTPLTFAGFAPEPSTDPPPANRPPPDGAGHFELILPYDAEVFVNDVRTMQTGFVRHYNTPKLTPGHTYNYRVRVRYVNAHGDIIEDTRDIQFHADDWFRIDFTRLPPPMAAETPTQAARSNP
jgi:uncharacterized protein (TIGR03000 family)